MSDTEFRHEDLPIVPNTFNPIMSVSGILPGMVVAASATPNTAVPANSADAATAFVTGMYLGPAPSTAGQRSQVRYSGVVALQAADWPLVTEEASVLTPGVPYYASDSEPGKITKTPPSGEGDVPEQIGVALSTIAILVQIGVEGVVGPPGPPASVTTQHLTTASNAGVLNLTDVSYVTAGLDSDGPQHVTLANGTTDGQEKTVHFRPSLSGETLVITPANFDDGTRVTLPSDVGGGVIFRWDATAVKWGLVGTYGGVVS